MTVLELVKFYISTVKNVADKRGSQYFNYSQCLSSLRLFQQKRPEKDCVSLVDSQYVLDYGRYLFGGGYAHDQQHDTSSRRIALNNSTLQNHFRYLRTLVRHAITDGFLPNIDVFKPVMTQLALEFDLRWPGKEVDSDRRFRVKSAVNSAVEFDKLVNCLREDLDVRYKVAQALPALLYALGIYTGGKEFAELLAATETDLPQSPKALAAIRLLNRYKEGGNHLVKRSVEWQRLENEGILSQMLTKDAARYFRNRGIRLFQGHSIFLDWLKIAVDKEVNTADIEEIIQRGKDSVSREKLAAIAEKVNGENKQWYVLCSYSPKMRNGKAKKIVTDYLEEQMSASITSREQLAMMRRTIASDVYDPQYIEKVERRGTIIRRNNPVLSRFLFVNATTEHSRKIDRLRTDLSMLRIPGHGGKFATVPRTAIELLITTLRDVQGYVEILDITPPEVGNAFTLGVKVRLLAGHFKTMEGEIIKVLKQKGGVATDDRRYRVQLATDLPVTVTARQIELELV